LAVLRALPIALVMLGALASPALAAPRLALPSEVVASEADPVARIPVGLSGPSEAVVRFRWRVVAPIWMADAPFAREGYEFRAAGSTVELAPGETGRDLEVPLIDDAIDESGAFAGIVIDQVEGAEPAELRTELLIADDEPTPAASVGDVSVRERDGFAVLRVTRPAPTRLGATRYAWETRSGSALAGSDFKSASGVVGFGVDDTSHTIRVPLVRDSVREPDERFTVTLGPAELPSPWGWFTGPIDDGVAAVTIEGDGTDLGDDGVPIMTASPLRGIVKLRGKGRLRGGVPVQRGDVIDARRGAARLWLPGVGPVRVSSGMVKIRSRSLLALAGPACNRRAAIAAPTGLRVRSREVTTRARGRRARWRLAQDCTGTRVTTLLGRVGAGGRVVRAGHSARF
jgi:hypothetical protein